MKTSRLRNRISQSFAIFAVCVTAGLGLIRAQDAPAPENRVEKLEKRMDDLDGKLDAILKAVSGNQPTAPTSPTPEPPASATTDPKSVPAAAPSKIQLDPGPLMDFWVLKDDAPLDVVPEEYSLGTVVDDKSLFLGKRFRDFPEFAPHWNSRIGTLWSGILNIKEDGKYTISADLTLNVTEKNIDLSHRKYDIVAWVDVEGTKVLQISEAGDEYNAIRGVKRVLSKSHPLDLSAGSYKVKIWLASMGQGTYQGAEAHRLEDMELTLKLRGPSDLKPDVLTKNLLLHRSQ